jgi:hypothetical protein
MSPAHMDESFQLLDRFHFDALRYKKSADLGGRRFSSQYKLRRVLRFLVIQIASASFASSDFFQPFSEHARPSFNVVRMRGSPVYFIS